MAINFYQAYAGQPIRTSTVGDSSTPRGRSSESTAAVSETEVSSAETAANALGTPGPESGLEAVAMSSVDPALMTRAVEQANTAAEAALRATNRSVNFQYDDRSGRVKMTITEERNGKEVTRQIPPDDFLDMVDRLQGYADGSELPRGTLLNLDG